MAQGIWMDATWMPSWKSGNCHTGLRCSTTSRTLLLSNGAGLLFPICATSPAARPTECVLRSWGCGTCAGPSAIATGVGSHPRLICSHRLLLVAWHFHSDINSQSVIQLKAILSFKNKKKPILSKNSGPRPFQAVPQQLGAQRAGIQCDCRGVSEGSTAFQSIPSSSCDSSAFRHFGRRQNKPSSSWALSFVTSGSSITRHMNFTEKQPKLKAAAS